MTEKAFIIKVIECVEKRPCLWDPFSSSYAKRDKLEKAWQEISQECEKPVSFCKDKWKNVRTGFLRSLREYPEHSTVSSTKRRPFYLHDNMQFLLPSVLKTESSTSNNYGSCNLSKYMLENNESEIVKVEDSSNSEILDYDELDNYGNVEPGTKVGYFSQFGSNKSENSQKPILTDEPPYKKLRLTNDNEEIRETKEEYALMSFFKGIASDVLSLSIQNQRFFKRKIVELVDDLHKEDEREQAIPKQRCICYPNFSNNGS